MTDAAIKPKALLMMERGIKALQKKNYKQAATTFTSLLEKFPAERTPKDRALGYIKVCDRMTLPKHKDPTGAQEILLRATYHLNRHEFVEARALLDKAKRKSGIKAETTYAFAIFHALQGEEEEALTALGEAIQLDEVCKYSARTETNFAALHELEQFQELVN